MAGKPKAKTSKGSFKDDDLLDSFFDDIKESTRGKASRGGPLHRTYASDNIFSMLAEEVKQDGVDSEDSDVSAADPSVILKNMKDMDDMDADLFSSKKKSHSPPAQTKQSGNEGPKKDLAVLESNVKPEGADEPTRGGKKPNSAPSSTTRNYKKFTFSDLDDPLSDPLDDLLPDETKPESKSSQAKPDKSVPSPSASPIVKKETNKAAKKGEITLDDEDDFIDALGVDSDKSNPKKKESSLWSTKERSEAPQRSAPRTRITEILESLTSPQLLEQPPTGERKDQLQSQEKQQQEKTAKEPLIEDDLTFGAYQPTVGSTPEGRHSRRQSVRFSTEDVSASTPEKKPKPTTPTSIRHRNSADWLGLKPNEEPNYLEDGPKETKIAAESPKASSSPVLERKSSLTGSQTTFAAKMSGNAPVPTDSISKHAKSEFSKSQRKEDEEDDWLAGALSRKKAFSSSNAGTTTLKQEDSLDLKEKVDLESNVSHQVTTQTPRGKEDNVSSVKETSSTFFGQLSPTAHSIPVREERQKQVPQPNQMQNTSAAVQQQPAFSADSLQQLLLQQQTQLLGLGGLQKTGDYQMLQARIIQLEGQVKTLQLERDQSQMMLENFQQRHKQDMELVENTHKTRVKLLEDSAAQREARAQHECEDLMERLTTVTRSAEQERSELQAQYQRKLAQAQQDRDREVERLRDLQRKSILEMKKDHEDQVHRLKRLKDEEIDAVTSATSQTRSLAGVIEQMEQFSSRLGELSSRVESTHEHTAHGLEQGARHRDEQLRTMQDRLMQQQKSMAEERTYLKEIIARMDTQLNEQQRQLEKERWKMTAEQAKAESTLKSLEEERRVLSMQLSIEREELDRAKSALLEEQKTVMQHCADERRKLAAEWAHFHAQEKQRHERAEREVSSLIEKREGSIISLAQEQADLKLRTAELKQKEMTVAQERETLERLREELDREKERISRTALRFETKSQEVEAFSKLAADKYEEGERALQEAKRVEAEHEARLRSIHSQTEQLRQQQQRILKEQMKLSHLQKDTERLRQTPSIIPLPQIIPPTFPDPVLADSELTAALNVPPPTSFANTQSMALQASLALWKYTAEKDREYLQEEQIFLDNLKKKSYRSPFNTD
uniref:Fas binding factor 1 n=1 Tax=Acanthochromis polyacanthus TaxID=80966 RepID=A0A3Q1GHT9_9TELE